MTAPEPAIRPYEPADLRSLQRIRRAAFAPVFRSFRALVGPEIATLAFAEADAEQARLLGVICAEGSGHQVLVATLGKTIAGFVSFNLDHVARTGQIGLNAVHPDHAGQGLGSRMYEEVLGRMRAEGMALAVVGTGGDPSHAPARRAYEKAGFVHAIPSLYLYRLL